MVVYWFGITLSVHKLWWITLLVWQIICIHSRFFIWGNAGCNHGYLSEFCYHKWRSGYHPSALTHVISQCGSNVNIRLWNQLILLAQSFFGFHICWLRQLTSKMLPSNLNLGLCYRSVCRHNQNFCLGPISHFNSQNITLFPCKLLPLTPHN